jgi:hypothetical protein
MGSLSTSSARPVVLHQLKYIIGMYYNELLYITIMSISSALNRISAAAADPNDPLK